MSIDAAGTAYYWGRILLLVLVTVLAALSAVRQSKSDRYSAQRGALRAALILLLVIVLAVVIGLPLNWLLAVASVVIGAGIGWLVGRGKGGASPVGPWVSAVALVLTAMTLLFGTYALVSVSLVLLVFGAAITAGQAVAGYLKPAPVDAQDVGDPRVPAPDSSTVESAQPPAVR